MKWGCVDIGGNLEEIYILYTHIESTSRGGETNCVRCNIDWIYQTFVEIGRCSFSFTILSLLP